MTEQLNPAGLSYTYQYEKDRITITDSLDRREVLHTQGEAGLKRVVKRNTRTAASRRVSLMRWAGLRHRRMPQAGQQSTARMW
ncbi:putative rHS repeat protein [Escherichia coli Jurua 18/11]|nr:putative rHS repeat protein [Escherichia coli Jurua 18/11]